MQTAGSAKNEMTARIGMIGGMFLKRFIMIFWALAGLLAIGLYTGMLHDPDLIWGFMSKDLLFPGAIGLMLVGILAANMSTLDAGAVSYSALFIKNLYEPFKPNKSEKHYLFVGRIAIAVTLLGGIAVALFVNNLLELFKYIISIPAIFGASIWLGFIWRRLTKSAVFTQVAVGDHLVSPECSMPLHYAVSSTDKILKLYPTGHVGMIASSFSQKTVLPELGQWLKERS